MERAGERRLGEKAWHTWLGDRAVTKRELRVKVIITFVKEITFYYSALDIKFLNSLVW